MPLPPSECKVYTPPSLANAMVSAIHCGRDVEWLDPCVGPGAFIEALRARKVRKDRIVALDLENAPGKFDGFARTIRGVDFFHWLPSTTARFDKIIANPPYVPIERLSKALQKPILSLNELDSGSFRLNSNYWCAFLAGSLRVLKDGGDLALFSRLHGNMRTTQARSSDRFLRFSAQSRYIAV
jgi:adenine-specific DNA-methyltransferase